MNNKCCISGCKTEYSVSDDFNKIPMFPLPKNDEIQNVSQHDLMFVIAYLMNL